MRWYGLVALTAIGCSTPARGPRLDGGADLTIVFDFARPPGDFALGDLGTPAPDFAITDGPAAPQDLLVTIDLGDLAVAPDRAASDAPAGDLSAPDLAAPRDAPAPGDLAAPDLAARADAAPPDLPLAADLATPDFAVATDFATPRDLASRPDLSLPRDLAPSPDLTSPPDLALPKATLEIDYCIVQFPKSDTVKVAMPFIAYAQVYQKGLTDAKNDWAAPGILGQIGYGPFGSDPRLDPSWRWTQAAPNPGYCCWQSNNDEYWGSFSVPAAGKYWYVYRFSISDGAGFTYCDTKGNGNGPNLPLFAPIESGNLTVTP